MGKHYVIKSLICVMMAVLNYSVLFSQNNILQVATNDCGESTKQPFLIKGDNFILTDAKNQGFSDATLSCNYGSSVVYAFDKLDIQADYYMEVAFLADSERVIEIQADGNPVCQPIVAPAWKEIRKKIHLPKKAYAYGQLVLIFEASKGPNAILSELKIESSNPRSLIPFEGSRKEELERMQTYNIDTNVDVESVMPKYAPFPKAVSGVYEPVWSLDGVWDFSESDKGNVWNSIQVPGQWSMQGFKVDSAGWARYRKTFKLPKDWRCQLVKLRFDGVHSEYKVLLNGHQIGYHEGGMTPYELTLSDLDFDKENELLLYVRSESDADMLGSLTQYAAHQLGGITRKVSLFALPTLHINDLRIVTDLDDQYKDAKLRVYAEIENKQAQDLKNVSLRFILDKHKASLNYPISLVKTGGSWKGWIEFDVEEPLLWNNEHPNLYMLTTTLSQENKELQSITKRIGFREVEVKANCLLVNGTPVKLRGVCRHEAHPLTGRVLTTQLLREDAELYRNANCNFIRTSHYPPSEEFIDLCDELGLFVEVEAPVCWIGHHANENWLKLNYRDSSYYKYVLQANMEMIQHYRNHPSILFWSMANESYWNKEFAQVGEYMKKADDTRPYAFHDQAYGGFNNQGSTAPIANIHYPGPNGYRVAATSKRPMVYGEYCHLNVYNRSELVTDPGVRSDWALALSPTWENMYKTDGVLGGSIWSGIDDIFQLPDGSAVGYGPWGPIDGWRRPKPEYWDMKKIYSPIRVLTKELQTGTSFDIEIENRYSFTNLNELKIEWKYGENSGIANGEAKPGKNGKFAIAADSSEANQLYIRFIDPRGYVADEYLIPVGKQHQNNLPVLKADKTKLNNQKNKYVISGKDFVCEISRIDGQIISLRRNNQEIINGGPWLMALPLNGGGCYPNHNANTPLFNDLCIDWKVKTINAVTTDNGVEINVEGSYKEFDGKYSLLVNSNGEVKVVYSFNALQDVNPRQWGLVFEAPKDYDTLFWRRQGLWSVYPDDHISRPIGETTLFSPAVPHITDARIRPTWSWSLDSNELGSNDFRSTRRNIWYAGLKDKSGSQLTVCSDGNQHWRSWLYKNKIRFLVADFVSAGNEMFLESYYAPYRKQIKNGDNIGGTIILRAE